LLAATKCPNPATYGCPVPDYVGFAPQISTYYGFKYTSVTILIVLSVQILALIACYGKHFFRSKFYVLDMVVVFLSLGFELFLNVTGGSLVTVLRAWRVLRIVHGLASSVEIQAKQKEVLQKSTEVEAHEAHIAALGTLGGGGSGANKGASGTAAAAGVAVDMMDDGVFVSYAARLAQKPEETWSEPERMFTRVNKLYQDQNARLKVLMYKSQNAREQLLKHGIQSERDNSTRVTPEPDGGGPPLPTPLQHFRATSMKVIRKRSNRQAVPLSVTTAFSSVESGGTSTSMSAAGRLCVLEPASPGLLPLEQSPLEEVVTLNSVGGRPTSLRLTEL
jgi:hypothetical protein